MSAMPFRLLGPSRRAAPLAALLALLLTSLLAGCQYGMPAAGSAADVGPGKIVLVGKVVLDPPLAKGEQDLRLGERGQEDLINLFTSQQQVKLDPDQLGLGDYRHVIKAPLGREFFALAPHDRTVITGAMLYLHGGDQVFFPGGLRYAAAAGDRALYLGTIRYRRNEFYEIIGMDVIDEYRQANAAFIRKFGNTLTLKKALLKPAR